MSLNILSQRGIFEGSAFCFLYELENLLVSTCSANLLIPRTNKITQWLNQKNLSRSLTKKIMENTIGLYNPIDINLPSDQEPNVLLVFCLNPAHLSMLTAIPEWRERFDVVAAYVIDAWDLQIYPKEISEIDHLFVPVQECVRELSQEFNIGVSLLPFGADVLRYSSTDAERPIDVMSFGRNPVNFHLQLTETLNDSVSHYLYYRHPGLCGNWLPDTSQYEGRGDHELRRLFHKMIQRSKIILAFDPLYQTDQIYETRKVNSRKWKFRHSILSLRWFEGCAAGCVILGKRPQTPLFDDIMGWKDSAIELPDDESQWIPFTLDLLADDVRLATIRQRNYEQTLAHHDWRYRIHDIFNTLNLKVPQGLNKELAQLSVNLSCSKDMNCQT
ncbi:glycosyltransferase [Crocosphaera sp. Alani8]|uniref:glycosyltransferase n=1 Tax=Crocosphaera sp. Alani8 TaxID=3038952 RepID=UPI00313B9552